MLTRIFRWIFPYWSWKKMARRAIAEGKTAFCVCCDDPIIPGDFVAVARIATATVASTAGECSDSSHLRLVHAGHHYTLNERDAFCETGGVGVGFWDGEKVVSTGPSAVAEAMSDVAVTVR
jgi:hypothetical protein